MAVSPIGAMMSAATAAPVTGTQQLGAAGIPTDTGQAGAAGGSDFGNVVTNALQGMESSQVFRGAHTQVNVRVADITFACDVANVHGEVPDWLHVGRQVGVGRPARSRDLRETLQP